MTDPVFAVIDATWPAAACSEAGGFVIREGKGGGSRVSAASRLVPWDKCDLDAAIAAERALGHSAEFQIRPDDAARFASSVSIAARFRSSNSVFALSSSATARSITFGAPSNTDCRALGSLGMTPPSASGAAPGDPPLRAT